MCPQKSREQVWLDRAFGDDQPPFDLRSIDEIVAPCRGGHGYRFCRLDDESRGWRQVSRRAGRSIPQ